MLSILVVPFFLISFPRSNATKIRTILLFTVSRRNLKGSRAFASKRDQRWYCGDRDMWIIVQGVKKGLYHFKVTREIISIISIISIIILNNLFTI